jgi:oligopeptide transport system substrate-binding protein
LVPPSAKYPFSPHVVIQVQGRECDVLAFDPQAARELLAGSGKRHLRFTYHFLNRYRLLAEILQQQWQTMLNATVTLEGREDDVHFSMVYNTEYLGTAFYNFTPVYMDPNAFLDAFLPGSGGNPSGWTDAEYTRTLSQANSVVGAPERMAKLAECERLLLEHMPVIPIYHDTWRYLSKPFVKGLACNAFDGRSFKYAWIDTNWRRS